MKKALIIIAVLALCGAAMAQDTTYNKWYFGGARLDYKPTASWHATGGTALPIGKNLWVMPGFDVGGFDSTGIRTSSLQGDVTWMFYESELVALHLFLEPGIDWVNTESSASAYLSGAVGVLGVLKFSTIVRTSSPFGRYIAQHFGVWGAWKYKTNFESASAFPAGNSFGFGFAYHY